MATPRPAPAIVFLSVTILVAAGRLTAARDDESGEAEKTPETLYAEAKEALRRAHELAAKAADALDRRGSEHFKKGDFKASVADFDRAIELDPAREPWHWRRGISYYYTGEYEKGQRQFEGYQSVDSNDVENVVWRFLCMARLHGPAKAREEILKVGDDRRVPMREVYELFAGRAKPQDVLAAARAGDPSPKELNGRLFYAHLYLGLYHEAHGDKQLAHKHLVTAAVEHRLDGYMWEVARVHAELYRKTDGVEKPRERGDRDPDPERERP